MAFFRCGGGEKSKLLWENPNPNSVFASSPLSIDGLSNYDYIAIECCHYYTWYGGFNYSPALNITLLENKENINQYVFTNHYDFPNTDQSRYGIVNRSGDTLTFSGQIGAYCVPIKIYGVVMP